MRRPAGTPAAITALGPRAPFAPFGVSVERFFRPCSHSPMNSGNTVTVTDFVVTDFSHEVVC